MYIYIYIYINRNCYVMAMHLQEFFYTRLLLSRDQRKKIEIKCLHRTLPFGQSRVAKEAPPAAVVKKTHLEAFGKGNILSFFL
jgi:hypothetical protein